VKDPARRFALGVIAAAGAAPEVQAGSVVDRPEVEWTERVAWGSAALGGAGEQAPAPIR
jgi:hypothetical protein